MDVYAKVPGSRMGKIISEAQVTDLMEDIVQGTPKPSNTPLPTQVINLPLVEQDPISPLPGTPGEMILAEPSPTAPTPTITPTTILPQDTSTNMPIVLGAIGIVTVVILAWLLFGRISVSPP